MTEFELKHGLSQDEPGPLEPVEIAQQPGAAPATGNTARDQEMYAAGIRTGEENAKHNAEIRAGVPEGWKLVPIEPTDAMLDAGIKQHRCEQGDPWYSSPDLGEGDCREIYAAMLNAAPAAPSASTAGTPQPARDWELTCHKCDGSGHVYVKHQVAERQSDVQEFKEECDCCEGRGFVFAFQDIPGIEEYVKTCRPAPAAPGVSTVEDSSFPTGAIVNGRVLADRLEAYPFESQGGDLRLCSDWVEFRRCFEYLAEWVSSRAPAAGDAQAWQGLTKDERDSFVGELIGYGTDFVVPLYAVVESIEKRLREKNDARAAAQRKGDA